MIWIVFIFLACKNDATKTEDASVKAEIKTREQPAHSEQSQPKTPVSSSNAPKDGKQTAGKFILRLVKKMLISSMST